MKNIKMEKRKIKLYELKNKVKENKRKKSKLTK